jgi:multisubunit Na+/H+ antiporter MnhC subunit
VSRRKRRAHRAARRETGHAGHAADPLPQALVLTAIVISFAMTAVLLVIALRTCAHTGSDHVDGEEPRLMAGTCQPGWAATRW